ncbi:MAG: hypothetical protein ACXADY_13255 [Candidatus Hodarchaeales archaeon]|jgi:hypothetical protein
MKQERTVSKLKNFRNKIDRTREDYNNALLEIIKSELPQSYTRLKLNQDLRETSNQIKSMVSKGEISETSLKEIVNRFEEKIKTYRSNLNELTSKIEQELYSYGIYRKFDFLDIKTITVEPLEKLLKYSDELDNFGSTIDNSIFDLNGTLEIQETEFDTITMDNKQVDVIKESLIGIDKKFSNIRLLFIFSVILNFILGLLISTFFTYLILVNIYPEPTAQVFTGFGIGIVSVITPIIFAVLNRQKNLIRHFEINKEKESINFICNFNEKKIK